MIVTLPLPHQNLKPNRPSHRMAKAESIAIYRAIARDEAMAAAYSHDIREPYKDAVVQVRAYWKTVVMMDPDNLLATMKSALDGLTDAGIWRDDRDVMYLPCVQEKDAENPRIEIVVLSRRFVIITPFCECCEMSMGLDELSMGGQCFRCAPSSLVEKWRLDREKKCQPPPGVGESPGG